MKSVFRQAELDLQLRTQHQNAVAPSSVCRCGGRKHVLRLSASCSLLVVHPLLKDTLGLLSRAWLGGGTHGVGGVAEGLEPGGQQRLVGRDERLG